MSNWLPDGTTEWGGRPVARTVADALPRCRATVTGTLASVAVHRGMPGRPLGTGPGSWLGAVLDDGTGVLLLRWLGRHTVPGVEQGARLTVEGTVSCTSDGRPVLLNPLYRFEDPRLVEDRSTSATKPVGPSLRRRRLSDTM
ncbi:MAG: single stranded DNA-binding domain-containing protein [Acidimicrobiales bacterium]